MKRSFMILFALLSVLLLAAPAAADGYESWVLGTEVPMPGNVEFEVHDSCLEHDWFEHYHAREDGWYIVVYPVANLNGADEEGFARAYIDIYNSEGVFQKELSLDGSDANMVARITETAVEIYLTNRYLSYDLETGEVTCHYTPANYVRTSGLYDELTKAKQQIGEWTYQSKGIPQMRDKLVREKNGTSETLLDLKGSDLSFPMVLIPVGCSALVLIILFVVKKNANPKDNTGGIP